MSVRKYRRSSSPSSINGLPWPPPSTYSPTRVLICNTRAGAGARFEQFLAVLPADMRCAFEFRHDSWHADEVFRLLEKHGAALCIADMGDKTTPLVATARHAYFRLRDEGYQPADLDRWAKTVLSHEADWDQVFVYFKHEDEGKGPEFAKAFDGMIGPSPRTSRPAPPSRVVAS